MAEPVALEQVADALDLGERAMVSLVGGGGKTTTMFALGHSLGPVIMTTTTRMQGTPPDGITTMVGSPDDEVIAAATEHDRVLVWQSIDGSKARGVEPGRCDVWMERVPYVLVEADGARRRPFTAPRPLEPVIPTGTTHVVACIGADALGRCIGDQCHRPLRIAALAGCSPFDRLTPDRAAAVLLHERGSRKDCPSAARFAVAITKVGHSDLQVAHDLLEAIGDSAAVVMIEEDDKL